MQRDVLQLEFLQRAADLALQVLPLHEADDLATGLPGLHLLDVLNQQLDLGTILLEMGNGFANNNAIIVLERLRLRRLEGLLEGAHVLRSLRYLVPELQEARRKLRQLGLPALEDRLKLRFVLCVRSPSPGGIPAGALALLELGCVHLLVGLRHWPRWHAQARAMAQATRRCHQGTVTRLDSKAKLSHRPCHGLVLAILGLEVKPRGVRRRQIRGASRCGSVEIRSEGHVLDDL
mmetsp:Transcript_60109/g.129054  ORF Transcript_60109/g.129054 Transcript_60109/m.129054 type:complete len:234 (-) Transcript_60109:2173-2874(-)